MNGPTDLLSAAENVRQMPDLTPADREILRVLSEGRATQGYIVSNIDYSRTHVHNRLNLMERSGLVENIHPDTALWQIADDAPRPPFDENAPGDEINSGAVPDDGDSDGAGA